MEGNILEDRKDLKLRQRFPFQICWEIWKLVSNLALCSLGSSYVAKKNWQICQFLDLLP